MQEATLCYPMGDGEVLLIRKKRGLGAGKYVGPGGKVEPGETPREAAIRETREEIGLEVVDPSKVGEFDFIFRGELEMLVHVYVAEEFEGDPRESDEADPEWFSVDDLPYEEMWEDDRYWLPRLVEGETFRGRFVFDQDGDELLERDLEVGVAVE